MQIRRFFSLAKLSVQSWLDDYAPSMGAAIAFYTVFSLAPLVMIVIGVAGFFWGEDAVRGELLRQIGGMVGENGASAIEGVIRSGAQEPGQGVAAGLISAGVLLVGATTVFAELQRALDRIWEVPAQARKKGIWNLVRARLLSIGLVLSLAFLLLVSLVVSTMLSALGGWLGGLMPGWEIVLQVLNVAVSFFILALLFAMIFRFMPQAEVAWKDVWVGAFVTALMFELGKLLIGLYVGKASIASSYAAAGSLVVVLIWVYYAAQVFLLGAEFTWVYANEHGSRAKKIRCPRDAVCGNQVRFQTAFKNNQNWPSAAICAGSKHEGGRLLFRRYMEGTGNHSGHSGHGFDGDAGGSGHRSRLRCQARCARDASGCLRRIAVYRGHGRQSAFWASGAPLRRDHGQSDGFGPLFLRFGAGPRALGAGRCRGRFMYRSGLWPHHAGQFSPAGTEYAAA